MKGMKTMKNITGREVLITAGSAAWRCSMKRSSVLVSVLSATIIGLMTPAAGADPNNQPATFQLHMERPNGSEAPNGDRVAVTGSGVFSAHPKSVAAAGTFTHTDASGNMVASGIWTATQLLSFEFYGCGVITFADPDIILPPNFCGGAL